MICFPIHYFKALIKVTFYFIIICDVIGTELPFMVDNPDPKALSNTGIENKPFQGQLCP